MKKMLILYDGTCLMCNDLIRKLIEADESDMLRVAALQHYVQSEAQETVPVRDDVDTVILIRENSVYYKSTAVLKAGQYIGYRPLICKIGLFVPRFIRDAVYDLVASNRYSWFGKSDVCIPPKPELRHKYLLTEEELTSFFVSRV